MGDLNGDGDLDAVTPTGQGDDLFVYFNSGTRVFTGPTSYFANDSRDLALADMDGDGDLDVVAADDGGAFRVFANAGSGSLVAPTWHPLGPSSTGTGPLSVAAAESSQWDTGVR